MKGVAIVAFFIFLSTTLWAVLAQQGSCSGCSFSLCYTAYLTASSCPALGGTYSGDPTLSVLVGGSQVAYSDDSSYGTCPAIVSLLISVSSGCVTVQLVQGCYSDGSCSATTSYSVIMPTVSPTRSPTSPTRSPTVPTSQPSRQPSRQPSTQPTAQPTTQPSTQPHSRPTSQPTTQPVSAPSSKPTRQPSSQPSSQPTSRPSVQPSCGPSSQPSRQPSQQPMAQPSLQPSSQPSTQPSRQPSCLPTDQPTSNPTGQPSRQPTLQPSNQPTGQPFGCPSSDPFSRPSMQPTGQPTQQPTRQPWMQPTCQPTSPPSSLPSSWPSGEPSLRPSGNPTGQPSLEPSSRPSSRPSSQPSAQPSGWPSVKPSGEPSGQPTDQPSKQPAGLPSFQPSMQPSRLPSNQPTQQPTVQPASEPSLRPSSQPSSRPSRLPTDQPSSQPSALPTGQPSGAPTGVPTSQPSEPPSSLPSRSPSSQPSCEPSRQPSSTPTLQPSLLPSNQPTQQPTVQPTSQPSLQPSSQPSSRPSTLPTNRPSSRPSLVPTGRPSGLSTGVPTSRPSEPPSSLPSRSPSSQPSCQPFGKPSSTPTLQPSCQPTSQPSNQLSSLPSCQPSTQPTGQPTNEPTSDPTTQPTAQPACQPSKQPTGQPTAQPTMGPTSEPSRQPTSQPTTRPSSHPSCQPSSQPSFNPTRWPTAQPSCQPSIHPSISPTAQPTTQPSDSPYGRPSLQPSSFPSGLPSAQPNASPTQQPSTHPSRQRTEQPSGPPTRQPTGWPSCQPSSQPARQPSEIPSGRPSAQPSCVPSMPPATIPSGQPTGQPSAQPSLLPTLEPTTQPTLQPSIAPTHRQTVISARPTTSLVPSMAPTARPSSSSALAVDTATQDALRSLVTKGTASSSTVTSVTADGLKLALAVVRPSNVTHNGTTTSYEVALPDSSTTVALALPSSLSGGAVAVVVTTVEVDASRFSSFGSSSGNGSSNSNVTVALPSPQLVSSVVSIQVSQLSSNGSLTATTVPYFETSVAVVRSNSSSGSTSPTVLAHNCTVGVVETVSVYCADTAVRLNLTCSGQAAATVRRQCPVTQAVCTVVDLADNSIVSSTFCRTVDLGSSVVCQCGGSDVNGSAIASTGRVSVGVFQVYGVGSLTSSVALASALSASDVASRSVLIFVSFGCFWGVGLLMLVVSWWLWVSKRHHSELAKVQPDAMPSLWLRLVLADYFQASVLVDGCSDCWWTSFVRRRWVQVLVASHPYLRVLRTLGRWWNGNGSARTSIAVRGSDRTGTLAEGSDRTAVLADDGHSAMLDVVQSLTALTMACFALALLYDFQYPEDDGFCAAQTTLATCESRKMLLDPFESQCRWRLPHGSTVSSSGSAAIDDAAAVLQQIAGGRVVETTLIASTATGDTQSCQFQGSNFSTLAFLVSYGITSVFAGVLGLLLDRCQEVLKAKEATVTLLDRQRIAQIADDDVDTGDVSTTTTDVKKRTAVREQLVVREYPEAVVRCQRDRHRCSSIGQRSKLSSGLPRRRHAVMDVAMLDSVPMAARQATRPSKVMMDSGAEATSSLDAYHETTAVSVTAQAVAQAKRSMSSTDYAVTMLRLAVADEVGRLGGPAVHHVCLMGLYRAFPVVATLRRLWLWQSVVVGVLVVCNGGALYYIVSKAAVRGFGWQVSFLKIALFEWFSEVVLLRSVEIALFDYGLCWLVGDEVEAAVRRLEAAAFKVTAGSSTAAEEGGVVVVGGAESVSQEMARQWSGLPESRWVASLREGQSASHGTVAAGCRIGGSDGRSDRRRRWWTRLLSRGSLETWKMAASFGSPLVLAWLVYMYYRFVDNWLMSLSAMGQGLVAMTVVLSVLFIGAAVRCWLWWRCSRADPVMVAFDKVDDDQLAIDIDDTSWVWSSSTPSWSQSLTSSSAAASWRLSDGPSNGGHRDGTEDGSIVSDDHSEGSLTLDAVTDGSDDTLAASLAVAIDVDWSHDGDDQDFDRACDYDLEVYHDDEWQEHAVHAEYDDCDDDCDVALDDGRGMTGPGRNPCAVGPPNDEEDIDGDSRSERCDGVGDDVTEDGVYSDEALFDDTVMVRQRTPPFDS